VVKSQEQGRVGVSRRWTASTSSGLLISISSPPTAPAKDTHPACFDDGLDYALWKFYSRRTRRPFAKSFCDDCTPKFQARMLEQGRCEHPETQFYRFSKILPSGEFEDEIVGLRSVPRALGMGAAKYEAEICQN